MKKIKLLTGVLAIIVITLLITNCGGNFSPKEQSPEGYPDSIKWYVDTVPMLQEDSVIIIQNDSVMIIQKDRIAKNDSIKDTKELTAKDLMAKELEEFRRKQMVHEKNLKKLERQNKIMDSLIMKK